jgi:type III pantothenate kinase
VSIAYVDIGNTKTKIAFIENGKYFFLSSTLNTKLLNDGINKFEKAVVDLDSVYIAFVGQKNVLECVIDYFVKEFGVKPVLLKTERQRLGLYNGYVDYSKLGVDRWLAMLAVLSECQNYVVISAGTAITIDVVIGLRHQGGFIVPGLTVMQKCLFSETSLIDSDIDNSCQKHGFLPTNTRDGIVGGTLYMAASFINSVINDVVNEEGLEFKVFASGGDFSIIQPLISHDVSVIPDLVIKGMVKLKNES